MTAANISKVTVIDSHTMRFKSVPGQVYEFSFPGDIRDIIEEALNNAIVTPRARESNKNGGSFHSPKIESQIAPTDKATPPTASKAAKDPVIHKEDSSIGELNDFSKN